MPVSQVSPGSTRPFRQLAEQSGSVILVQPLGQHPSPTGAQAVAGVGTQTAEQDEAVPCKTNRRQATEEAGHEVGQLPALGAPSALSHVSPASTTPLPHTAGQSLSTVRARPAAGQHPSPGDGVSMIRCAQVRWQPEPTNVSTVQGLPSSQLPTVGQAPSRPLA